MPNYKLTYFDARARGEPARMLFALVGQKYEDIRYDFEGQEWPKIKGDLKSKQSTTNLHVTIIAYCFKRPNVYPTSK